MVDPAPPGQLTSAGPRLTAPIIIGNPHHQLTGWVSCTPSIGDGMSDFSILMWNRLQFSSCQMPDQPTTEPQIERLRVTLQGTLLMIAAAPTAGAIGNTLYARRTVVLDGAAIFMILPRPPRTITDPNFFKAIGSVVVFDGPGPRRLKAVGIDTLTKDCRGWIFDAVETD